MGLLRFGGHSVTCGNPLRGCLYVYRISIVRKYNVYDIQYLIMMLDLYLFNLI